MEQQTRIKYFEDLKKCEPYSYKDIYYQGRMQKLPVYRIDLEYLIYNRWNGRIASLVKSYEHEYGVELDASDPKSYELIEEFLLKSHKSANENTYESIKDHGQKEYGIVTKDGVIIDGNRRAMLLRRKSRELHESPSFFLGVVLDQKLFDNHKEIMLLETTYQMGEDAKVDYNPIEKYLKCKDMVAEGFSTDVIGKAMGEEESTIKEYLEIMELMDEYLDLLGYKGIYTRLDKTEDLFINLNKVYRRWKTTSGKVQWNAKDSDISDFKLICFDYIRYVYNSPKGIDAKEVRENLTRNSESSFFAHKNIWKGFSDRHKKIDEITSKEESIDEMRAKSQSRDLSSLLKSRDEQWAKNIDSIIKENYNLTKQALENLEDSKEPVKLLKAALAKIESIDINSPTFLNEPKAFEIVDTIRKWSDNAKKHIMYHRKHG